MDGRRWRGQGLSTIGLIGSRGGLCLRFSDWFYFGRRNCWPRRGNFAGGRLLRFRSSFFLLRGGRRSGSGRPVSLPPSRSEGGVNPFSICVHGLDHSGEHAIHHLARISSDHSRMTSLGRNARTGDNAVEFVPNDRAGTLGITAFVSVSRPFGFVARLLIRVPDDRFSVPGSLKGAAGLHSVCGKA